VDFAVLLVTYPDGNAFRALFHTESTYELDFAAEALPIYDSLQGVGKIIRTAHGAGTPYANRDGDHRSLLDALWRRQCPHASSVGAASRFVKGTWNSLQLTT
jgi:hypothetical protein